MQGFDKRLYLVFEHARHQPLAAFFIDLVQRKQRHVHGDTVFVVARLVQVSHRTVHAA